MRKLFYAVDPHIPNAALPITCGHDAAIPFPSISISLTIPSSSIPLPLKNPIEVVPPQLDSSSYSEAASVSATTPVVSASSGVETSGKVMPKRSTCLKESRSGRGGTATAGGASPVQVVELESAPKDAGKSSILGKRNWETASATPEPSTKFGTFKRGSSVRLHQSRRQRNPSRLPEDVLGSRFSSSTTPMKILFPTVSSMRMWPPFSPAQLRLVAR